MELLVWGFMDFNKLYDLQVGLCVLRDSVFSFVGGCFILIVAVGLIIE